LLCIALHPEGKGKPEDLALAQQRVQAVVAVADRVGVPASRYRIFVDPEPRKRGQIMDHRLSWPRGHTKEELLAAALAAPAGWPTDPLPPDQYDINGNVYAGHAVAKALYEGDADGVRAVLSVDPHCAHGPVWGQNLLYMGWLVPDHAELFPLVVELTRPDADDYTETLCVATNACVQYRALHRQEPDASCGPLVDLAAELVSRGASPTDGTPIQCHMPSQVAAALSGDEGMVELLGLPPRGRGALRCGGPGLPEGHRHTVHGAARAAWRLLPARLWSWLLVEPGFGRRPAGGLRHAAGRGRDVPTHGGPVLGACVQ